MPAVTFCRVRALSSIALILSLFLLQLKVNASETGAINFEPCSLAAESGWARRAQCAWLSVPFDPKQPAVGEFELSIIRIATKGKLPASDPVLMFAGGPGQAASDAFLFADYQYKELHRTRDIYLIDQRGTGRSAALSCAVQNQPEALIDQAAYLQQAKNCLQQLPYDARFFTTSLAINDFELVRKALNISQWNLLGVSYGTRVAQHYLRRHPEAIRTLTLDSTTYPELNLGPDIALQSQRALDHLLRRCAADEFCRRQFPELSVHTQQLLTRLKKAPHLVHFEDLNLGQQVTMNFSYEHLLTVIRLSLYQDETMALLPLWLEQAYGGNFSALARIATELIASMGKSMSLGMHNTVMCSEEIAFIDLDSVDMSSQQNSYFGKEFLQTLLAQCEFWPRGEVDADYKKILISDKPTLLMSGELDPITPPAYAEKAAEHLSNSRHVIFPGQGHYVSTIGCGPRLLAKFVESASFNDLPISCVDELQAADFFVNVNGPEAAAHD